MCTWLDFRLDATKSLKVGRREELRETQTQGQGQRQREGEAVRGELSAEQERWCTGCSITMVTDVGGLDKLSAVVRGHSSLSEERWGHATSDHTS